VSGLGQLEREIMDQVWRACGPVTGRQVVDELRRTRTVAYTTVLTIMDRLTVKGVLTRRRSGRAFLYEAVRSREEYTADVMREVLDSAENPRAVLLHFLRQIPPEAAAELHRALGHATDEEPDGQ
jgi:predicted transcriptional regulator